MSESEESSEPEKCTYILLLTTNCRGTSSRPLGIILRALSPGFGATRDSGRSEAQTTARGPLNL